MTDLRNTSIHCDKDTGKPLKSLCDTKVKVAQFEMVNYEQQSLIISPIVKLLLSK